MSSVAAVGPGLDLMSPARLAHRAWTVYKFTREVKERAKTLAPEPPQLTRDRANLLQEMCKRVIELHGLDLVVHGTLPEPPYIMVCNHLGYMDPVILAAIQACQPVAKRELGDWPIIAPALNAMGIMLVNRGDLHQSATVLRRAMRVLEAGVAVVNFPEGTTTIGDEVLPFKRGIFGIAKIAQVPVVPARIDFQDPKDCWIGDDTFLPHYLRYGAIGTHHVRMRITDPVDPNDYESAQAMADQLREHIVQLAPR